MQRGERWASRARGAARAWLPDVRGRRRLFAAMSVDALGTGLFLPFAVLCFAATTGLGIGDVGLALSLAALVRIPATVGSGMLSDRIGARATVVASNIGQAVGFTDCLLARSFGHLLAATVVVQLGNSAFWVAYPALVHDVADGRKQESWFAAITALRGAGTAVGALAASLAVAVGGTDGYVAILAVNALSFAVAGLLTGAGTRVCVRGVGGAGGGRDGAGGGHEDGGRRDGDRGGSGAWSVPLRDRPFLWFVVLNFGLAVLSLAFGIAVPVYLIRTVHLPAWLPGTVLAVNAVLGAVCAGPVGALLTGRRRGRSLVVSQTAVGGAFLAVLGCAYVPHAAGVALVLAAVVLLTAGELIQNLIVPPVVNDSAGTASRGRYNSLAQLAFSLGDIVTPALMTALLAHGPLATWAPMTALTVANMLGAVLLARHLPALRRRINDPGAHPAEPGRHGPAGDAGPAAADAAAATPAAPTEPADPVPPSAPVPPTPPA